jgi:hypothetical protein
MPLEEMAVKQISDGRENKIFLCRIEGSPGLLPFGSLPDVEAIEEACIQSPD